MAGGGLASECDNGDVGVGLWLFCGYLIFLIDLSYNLLIAGVVTT